MSGDILERLIDLHKQATTERSHYYVGKCCKDAISEIRRLRAGLSLIAENTSGKNAKSIAQLSLVIARETLQPGYAAEVGKAPAPQASAEAKPERTQPNLKDK